MPRDTMSDDEKLESDPRAALEIFIFELQDDYYSWYESAVKRLRWSWYFFYWISLITGAAASVIAGVGLGEGTPSPAVRVSLILLPFIAAFLSTIAAQSRLTERFELRERGRLGIQSLINEGRRRFTLAKSSDDFGKIYQDLAAKVKKIEAEQGSIFFVLAKSQASQDSAGET